MTSATGRQDRHIAAAKSRLAHLGALAAKTAAAEQQILAAAESRLETVAAELERLRPRALADRAVGDRYQALTLERGRLETIIANARQVLQA